MKNFKNYLAFLAVFALFFTSCSKDEAGIQNEPSEDVASLTFASIMSDFNKSAAKQMDEYPDCSDATPTHAQISLVYGDADIPVDVQVDISQDGDGLFTVYDDALEIPVPSGQDWVDVTLLNFDVYSGTTLTWTAPMDGSEFGAFVTDALPMDFQLRAGSKNYVDVEVLCFDNREVNRYGYQFFNIIPEQLRQLCFFVNYCSDEGRHYTADYDLNVYYYAGSDVENVTWADLDLIYSDSPAALSDNGAFYTDPLCLAIPEPQLGEAADQPYLYYEVSLVDWNGNYPSDDVTQTGFLTWNDIVDLLDPDNNGNWQENSDSDYYHVQLNCGDDNGGGVIPPDDCPPAPADGCFQLVYDDQFISIDGLGLNDNPVIPLVYNDEQIGEIELNLEADFDLVATITMDSGYIVTASELSLSNYIDDSVLDDEVARSVCVSDLTNENTYVLTIQDLRANYDIGIDDIYPFTYDLTINFCPE